MTMVASFMPSIAFAAVATDADHGITYNDHKYAVTVNAGDTAAWDDVKDAVKDASKVKDYVSNVTAPTHTEKGSATLKCMQLFCDEEVTVEIAALGHDVDTECAERDFTLEAYAAKMLEQEEPGFKNAAQADTWVKTKKAANGCYVKNVKVCSCGYVKPVTDAAIEHHTNTTHADKACPQCGETIKGEAHVVPAPGDIGDVSGMVKVSEPTCGKGTGYEYECSCGAKTVYYHDDVADDAHNYGTPVDVSVATTLTKDGKYAVKSGYVGVKLPTTTGNVRPYGSTPISNVTGFKFYKLNKVVTPATGCNTTQTMALECETCGKTLPGSTEDTTVAHDWEKTHVAATCDHAGYNTYVCKACGVKGEGNGKPDEVIAAEKKLAHNYKVTKVASDCTNHEYYVIECTTCDSKNCDHKTGVKISYDFDATNATQATRPAGSTARLVTTYLDKKSTDKVKVFAYQGFDKEFQGTDVIELSFDTTAVPGHKYGKKELLKPATCTSNEVWGYKCTECGKIATHTSTTHAPEVKAHTDLGHDHPVVAVAATCVNKAYETKVAKCTRCGEVDAEIVEANKKAAENAAIKDGKHAFDKWVVTKDSTVFEEGVKSLECSVCGADGNAKTVIAKKTVAKASNTVKAGKKSFNVKSSAANATGYRVYYKKAGAKSWKSYTKKTTSLSKTFSGLSKGKYYVKVRAYAKNYDGDGQVVWGATSSTKSVKVK